MGLGQAEFADSGGRTDSGWLFAASEC